MALPTTADEPVDEEQLDELVGMAVNELGAAYYAPLIVIGDRLGLYEALADGGPFTPAELAERTDTVEPYVAEWLAAGAAGGYVTYDSETGRYGLTPEQAALLADEDSPAFLAGGFQGLMGYQRSLSELEADFRTGAGVGWHEHDADVCHGTERFYRPGYETSLVDEWIPALDGIDARLEAGGRVADVGCGHGASTIIMAPLVLGEFHQQVFEETDTEIIYLPHIVEKFFETYPERAREAIDRGHLTLRTRDELPYGLALFDERVGIGGYEETTGLMQVFVDTDAPIAREWAERVYASVRADSNPLDARDLTQ